MGVEVTCTQCGHKNPLGRVFCMKCGAKLNLDSLSPKSMRDSVRGQGGALARLFRWVVTLALLFAIIQILRPVAPSGHNGSAQDALRLRQKLGLLKGAALDGRAASQRISEVEVNSYLAELVQSAMGGSSSDLYRLRTVNVAMENGKITVVLVSSAGPASLSYEMVGTPARTSDRHFLYDVETVRLGHLPMPGPLGQWVAGQAHNVFSKMRDERELLDRMARVQVGQREIEVATPGQP
jgi:hypothetical protein